MWEHTTPVIGYWHVKAFGKEEVWLPQHGNKKDTDDFSKENTYNAEEWCEAQRNSDVDEQFSPCCPNIREKPTSSDINFHNTAGQHDENVKDKKIYDEVAKKIL